MNPNLGKTICLLLFSTSFILCELSAQVPDTLLANQYYVQARQFGDAAKYDRSISYYEKAKGIYKKAGHWPGYVKCLNGLGACHTLISEHKKAQEHLQLALSIGLEKLGEQPEVADTFQNLGFDWSRNGDYEKQFSNYKKALEIRLDKLGPLHPKVAQTYSSLSVSYKFRGDYESALKHAKKGLEIHLKTLDANNFSLSQSYTNVGAIYLSNGEYARAQNYFLRALDVMSNAMGEQNQFKAIGYSNLGKSYDAQGYYGKAIEAYQNALDILIGTLGKKHVYAGIFYNNLGSAWLNNGNSKKALECHQKALDIFSATLQETHPYRAITYINLGKCLGTQGNKVQSLKYFHKGMAVQEKTLGPKHPDLANTYHILGLYYAGLDQWEKALLYFQKSLTALAAGFYETDIYVNPTLEDISSKKILLDVLRSKAKTLQSRYYRKSHNILDLNSSLSTYELALKLIDHLKFEMASTISKQELLEKSIPIYEEAIGISYELFKIGNDRDFLGRAFEYSEKSKAFLLLQALKDPKVKKFAGIPDSIIDLEKELKIKSVFYDSRLHDAVQKNDSSKIQLYREKQLKTKLEFENLGKQIKKSYPRYHGLKYNNKVTSVKEVQERLLGKNSVLLEFFDGTEKIYVFSIARKSFDVYVIEKTEEYEKLIHDFREGLTEYRLVLNATGKTKRSYVEAAHKLYRMFLEKPLARSSRSCKKMIIAPDGKLNYLSFEALLTNLPTDLGSFRYRDLDYLVKDHDISYTYSSTFLESTMEPSLLEVGKGTKYVFGGFAPEYTKLSSPLPIDGPEELATHSQNIKNTALPGALKEVRAIADKFNGKAWLESVATEKKFKETAQDYQILHLAMHGRIDDDHPMYSKLLFSRGGDNGEDGYLHAAEIYNLELNADLTVLSACNSGFGKINKGEGMMSLSRAFAYAGCPSLVTSLWKVPDETTVHSMVDFYDNLIDGLPKDEALRKAKLNYLQNIGDPLYEHPYFWAGFINVGDTRPLVGRELGSSWSKYIIIAPLAGIAFLLLFRRRKQRGA